MLIDKLIAQVESEIAELKRDIESLNITIDDVMQRRDKKVMEEKEARKLYKSLRGKQPERVKSSNDPNYTPKTNLTNGNSPDYDGAIEVLKEDGKEFTNTEFMELAGVTDRKISASKLMRLVDNGTLIRTQEGNRGEYDSARWKVA